MQNHTNNDTMLMVMLTKQTQQHRLAFDNTHAQFLHVEGDPVQPATFLLSLPLEGRLTFVELDGSIDT